MNILLGIPVMDQHELTRECVQSLSDNVRDGDSVEVCIIDNNSIEPYRIDEFGQLSLYISVERREENQGYYYPMSFLEEWSEPGDLIGLMHNDVLVYTSAWDKKLRDSFVVNPTLGMIGFCGSDEVDHLGGRGGGTMSNFAGRRGQLQEHTGRREVGLKPAAILDSLFMMIRRECYPVLEIDDQIAPCHFYDKIWPMRLIDGGWRVAVLGIEIDHLGGQTAVGNPRFRDDAKRWCERVGVHLNGHDPESALYLEAERRWLNEWRSEKLAIPGKMRGWDYLPLT